MKKTSDQTVVGFFVIVGFLLLAMFVFFISGAFLFKPGYDIYVNYDYVSILDKGAPIRMAGVRVGEVRQVDLVFDPVKEKSRVRIKLFIEQGAEIRENYDFKIQGTHILSEPHIEITPKPGKSPILKEGANIEGVPLAAIEDMIEQAQKIAQNLSDITDQVKVIFSDPDNAKSMKKILNQVDAVTKSMQQVLQGNEDSLKKSIKNLEESTASLKGVLSKLDEGQGTAGKLIGSDELYQDMRSFVSEIKTHPWRLLKKDKDK